MPATLHRKMASLRKMVLLLAPALMGELRWPKLPRVNHLSPDAFTRKEINALLRGASRLSSRDNAIINLAVWTGARVASLAAAKLSNLEINPRSGSIRYDVTKGDAPYAVPLNSEARAALSKWLEERPAAGHDFIFCAERWPFRPLSPWAVYSVWKKRLARSVPEELAKRLKGTHQARHSLARLALEQGASLPQVSALLNHRSLAVTSWYLSPSSRELASTLSRLVGDEEEGGYGS